MTWNKGADAVMFIDGLKGKLETMLSDRDNEKFKRLENDFKSIKNFSYRLKSK